MKRYLMTLAVSLCLAAMFTSCGGSGIGGDGGGGGGTAAGFIGTVSGIGGDGGGGGGTSPSIGGDGGGGGGTAPLSIDIGMGKSLGKEVSTEVAPIQCDTVEIYGLTTGKLLASGTCGADGKYTLTVPVENLKGNATDEKTGDSFTFRGVFKATKGDKVYYGFIQTTISSSPGSATVDMDPDSTLAVLELLETFGITDLANLSAQLAKFDVSALTNFNPGCFFSLQTNLFGTTGTEAAGNINSGLIDACNIYAAVGTLPTGYTNWEKFLSDCTAGKEEALSALDSIAEEYDIDTAALAGYANIFNAFNDLVSGTFSGASCETKLADASYIDTLISTLFAQLANFNFSASGDLDPSVQNCIEEHIDDPNMWESCFPTTDESIPPGTPDPIDLTVGTYTVSGQGGTGYCPQGPYTKVSFSGTGSPYISSTISQSYTVKFTYDGYDNCSYPYFCTQSSCNICNSCTITETDGRITGTVNGCSYTYETCSFTLMQEIAQ